MLQALWYTCCKAAGVLCTFEIKKIKKLTLQNNWNWVTSPTQPVILTASHAQFMYCSCLRYVMCVYCWAERKVRLVMLMCLQSMAAKVKLSSNKFCFLMYWNLVCGSCFHHLYVPVYSQSIEAHLLCIENCHILSHSRLFEPAAFFLFTWLFLLSLNKWSLFSI